MEIDGSLQYAVEGWKISDSRCNCVRGDGGNDVHHGVRGYAGRAAGSVAGRRGQSGSSIVEAPGAGDHSGRIDAQLRPRTCRGELLRDLLQKRVQEAHAA